MLDWAFTVMGLRNVLLVTFSWNLPAIRAYSKAGFREIGRRRGAVVTLGQRYDQVLMDAVAEEFTGSVLATQTPLEDRPADQSSAGVEMFVRSSRPARQRHGGHRGAGLTLPAGHRQT